MEPAAESVSERFSANIEKFLPPLLSYSAGVQLLQFMERLGDRLAGGGNHGGGVAMGAASGFLEDLVDHAEAQHVLRRDLHAGRRFLRLGAVAPQDRGSCLRR